MTKKDKTKRLGGRELCPCESGLSYGACCNRKGIEYHVNRRGEIVTRVPISAELQDRLEEAEERFRAIFGRSMGRGDLILFDQFLQGEEDRWQLIRRIARR